MDTDELARLVSEEAARKGPVAATKLRWEIVRATDPKTRIDRLTGSMSERKEDAIVPPTHSAEQKPNVATILVASIAFLVLGLFRRQAGKIGARLVPARLAVRERAKYETAR